ncbi:TPA: TetR family transcriptional regulator C-terminal domain-containing protein [Pseudomonas aeruginosa]
MKKIRQRNLQLILDAACEVFADCGFSAARLSDVAERIRQWIDEGLLAPLDPYHLLLNLWAMTESYALGGWQLARLTGQAGLDASDYRQAAENIVRLVCAGCLALPGEAAPRRRFRALAG